MKQLVFLIVLLLSFSCSSFNNSKNSFLKKEEHNPRGYQMGAVLWFQTSGEYRALCYQAYNLARLKLDLDLLNKHNRKRAVVFDIDETVLDNSFYTAHEIKNKSSWDFEGFSNWIKMRSAEAVPGALEFIKYAEERQVEVIYISNREVGHREDTLANLLRLGIPAKFENLYFLSEEKSKEKRRLALLQKYEVVLYFGDNLGDFHRDWDGKGSDERRALVDTHREHFGDKFIILPNPIYGDWENSLPQNKKMSDLIKTVY